MRTRMFAMSAGIIWVGFWPALVSWFPVLLLALFLLILARGLTTVFAGLAEVLLFSGFLLTGVCWHLLRAEQRLDQRLPEHLEGQDLLVQGYVATIPEQRPAGDRFQFVVESAEDPFTHGRILLNSYGHQQFKAGQRWQLVVRLQQPHGSANPGSFDYEAWLFQQGIAARGYIRASDDNRQLPGTRRFVLTLRSTVRDRLLTVTEGLSFQSVLLALTLGERGLLTDQQWALFTQTGTNHLVVISGLHVVLVATLCALVFSKCWRMSGRLMILLPAQQAGAVAGIGAALLYSALAGFALPTQRAVIMVVVFVLSRLLALNGNNWFSLQLAMLLVLLLDPLAATGSGFWLSFTAVSALLLVYKKHQTSTANNRLKVSVRRMVTPQLAVFVGLLVPLGFWQGQIALLAPVANFVAIPVVSWLVVPLSLLASLLSGISTNASQWLFGIANLIFSGLYLLLERLVLFSGFSPNWQVNPLANVVLVPAGIGALLLLLPGYANSRWLATLLLSPLFWTGTNAATENILELHVLDVGQGLAVVLRTASHTLVYDTGPRFSSGFDSGSAIVYPALRQLGVKQVDLLVVSHGDNDHAGGVAGLVAAMPVKSVIAGEHAVDLSVPVHPCVQDQTWSWDGVDFRFLHPAEGGIFQGNNSSCVLLISTVGFQLLLPGDIDARIERRLLNQPWPDDRLEVLVSAHHGSNTSSSLSFLANIHPQLVIHSAGYRNQFGHPTPRVQDRIERLGGEQLNTADSGMISVALENHGMRAAVHRYREAARRYWRWSKSSQTGR